MWLPRSTCSAIATRIRRRSPSAHVYNAGVCGLIDLSAFERFGVAEDPVDSHAIEMLDTMDCLVRFQDLEDPRGVGTLRISLTYQLRPDGSDAKLEGAEPGPETRPQPLPAGAWEEGTVGVWIDEDATTVHAGVRP